MSMRILALVSSPRKQGNTDIIVEEILKGARINGHSTEKIRLYDHDILPCIDCRNCKRSELGHNCTLSDGMQEIYKKLEAADIIIFGTPIYWYGPTAKMKLLIDRLRPFIASKKLSGKKGIIVVPSEEGPDCCGPMMQMFQMSFEYLGMQMGGSILAKAYERGEIKKNPADLLKAFDLGASLG
jgi:multimeric flavodoxin WrbA